MPKWLKISSIKGGGAIIVVIVFATIFGPYNLSSPKMEIASFGKSAMTPSMTYIEPTVLSPIDLLLDNDDTVGTDRIRAAFSRLSTAAQNHLGELAGFSEIQISVSESTRWMNIRFRLQTTGEADWTLMGQIIGRDRLRYAVAIQLQPRIMSRSDILAGGEMPASVMRD